MTTPIAPLKPGVVYFDPRTGQATPDGIRTFNMGWFARMGGLDAPSNSDLQGFADAAQATANTALATANTANSVAIAAAGAAATAISEAATAQGTADAVTIAFSAHDGAGGAAHAQVTAAVDGFMIAADKSKLDGVAAGATANQPDTYLLSRANHTGTQAWSTITGTPTTVAGYGITNAAVLNGSSRTTNGIDTTDDVITDSTARGPVMKSPNGHYWRAAISNLGVVTWTDLGTTKP